VRAAIIAIANEAYFHPVSFKTLIVSRRGEILYRAK